jgi:ADP-ribose pyrophosphatase
MKKWKRLGSKKLLEHPRLSVIEDVVELPNGQHTTYIHFGDMLDAGMVLARNGEGKFLVQKEYSYPPDEFLYQLAGGSLEAGEDPAIGAAREFAEESGLSGDLEPLGWFYHNNRRSSQRMHVYLATNLQEVHGVHKDPEEEFEDHWFSEAEVDELIRSNAIRNYTFLAGWGLYKANQQ